VYTIERLETLAAQAQHRLETLGYVNVQVRHADGTLGWPAHAPYNGIVVTAGGPNIPQALQTQLAVGGRLVMPVGTHPRFQMLNRITRQSATAFHREELGPVCFVPLIGAQGSKDDEEVALRLLYDQLAAVVESEQQDDAREG
jgi:protein-L-isoaspartate(D-aspartate) O-methyltransferase